MNKAKKLRYKVAGKKFLSAWSVFKNEIKGNYTYQGKKYHCPVCDTDLQYFNSIDFNYLKSLEDNGYVYPIFSLETSTLFQHACPKCRATDRDRLYALYFNKKLAEFTESTKLKLVDFAPQPGLSSFLRSNSHLNYRSADLFMENVDDKVDLTDMNIYADNSFDIFICSHILEHIKDDKKAMRELYRILKPGGWGIAMVPVMLGIKETFEDDSIVSDGDRWKYYMQNDHVRMYSKSDFISKLEDAGFKVNQFDAEYFGAAVFEKNGIQSRSVLYVVEK